MLPGVYHAVAAYYVDVYGLGDAVVPSVKEGTTAAGTCDDSLLDKMRVVDRLASSEPEGRVRPFRVGSEMF